MAMQVADDVLLAVLDACANAVSARTGQARRYLDGPAVNG